MSHTFSNSMSGGFSRAITPQLDRRAHTDRRSQLKPMPVLERTWARHALVAGVVGVLLGSSGAMALLAQRVTATPDHVAVIARADSALPALAVMAPLFDTTPFLPPAPNATETSTPVGTESYSEDAAGVPSATYQEPPKARPQGK